MMAHSSSPTARPVVGLIPAAGWGRRLGTLPCSKEVYPVGWDAKDTATGMATTASSTNGTRTLRPKVASQYLLDAMRAADVETAYIIIREGKWDIPQYWGDGHRLNMHLAYLMMRLPHGTPFTLNQAYAFVQDRTVVMGFPDVIFEPSDAYVHLLDRLHTTDADVVLGLFPAERPHKVDMVALNDNGRPQAIDIKPDATDLTYTWVCVVWAPSFTHYLHETVMEAASDWNHDEREMYVGHVFQHAIRDGLTIDGVRFPQGQCTDLGTPDVLQETAAAAHRPEPPSA